MSGPSLAFKTLLKSAINQERVVPVLRSELWRPDFKGFNVKVEGFKDRPFDGYFHPSTHPTWTEPMLYAYMSQDPRLLKEPLDPTGTIAVTFGSFMHTFVQKVLVRAGVLVRQPEVCSCGQRHPERAEIALVDEEVKSRGHSDGVLADIDWGFEFKSMNPNKLGRVPKGEPTDHAVLKWFIEKCPVYYAQAQEYLRISGRKVMVVVIMSTSYPFEMREVHVPYVYPEAIKVRDKFARVLQAVADQRRPECECSITTSSCPAWGLCWSS